MVEEEIEIQTVSEVKNIDYMRSTNQAINQITDEHLNQMQDISDSLSTISDAITDSVDLSSIEESVNNIDTTTIEVQTQDILSTINQQQEEIATIKTDIQEIKQLLNQLIKQT